MSFIMFWVIAMWQDSAQFDDALVLFKLGFFSLLQLFIIDVLRDL